MDEIHIKPNYLEGNSLRMWELQPFIYYMAQYAINKGEGYPDADIWKVMEELLLHMCACTKKVNCLVSIHIMQALICLRIVKME